MDLQKSKTVVSLLGTGVTNGATVTANIDTLGYKRARVRIIMGTSDGTSDNPSVCKLGEADVTNATSFSDITAFVGDGAGGWTIPNANTSDPNVYEFDVDLRGRKRYLKATVSPTTTQQTVLVADLAGGDTAPVTTTEMGVHAVVRG